MNETLSLVLLFIFVISIVDYIRPDIFQRNKKRFKNLIGDHRQENVRKLMSVKVSMHPG
jgi:hypothetical protein